MVKGASDFMKFIQQVGNNAEYLCAWFALMHLQLRKTRLWEGKMKRKDTWNLHGGAALKLWVLELV